VFMTNGTRSVQNSRKITHGIAECPELTWAVAFGCCLP
jgi:hypothetical protein